MPTVITPNGARHPAPDGRTVAELAAHAAPKISRKIVAGLVDGALVGLDTPVEGNVEVTLALRESAEGLAMLRHSASHVMAAAVVRLFPGTRLGIGPAIEHGFYYDFELEHKLTPEDLDKVADEMQKIIAEDIPFARSEMTRDDAKAWAAKTGQPFKAELIDDLDDETLSFYANGSFSDLCRGPHLPGTGRVGPFKLLSVAGAYWRGDEKRPMLQRIYGTAFWSRKDLDKHLAWLEEIKARDHRVLGKALDFYSIDEEIGPGLILWHPNGALVRYLVEDFWIKEHMSRGYKLLYTPHIASEKIYEHSGHLANYAENMYAPMEIEGMPYRLKPMNCPAHIKIFQSTTRSYRDLPIRYCELGTVYRYERSGALHGMLRVRGFTQDDSHIFCTREQIAEEVAAVLDLVDAMMDAFGYKYKTFLATRPEKSLGTDAEWDWSTEALREALKIRGQDYEMDEGGGVFYAPKIDVKLLDALGREWQGPTIQVDLNLPKRFDVKYIGADNQAHETVIIHRTVLGSMERFIGGLLEHYGGAFPLWLAPEQVRVITISDAHTDYATSVNQQLREAGFRAALDIANEKTSAKIRRAAMDKIPIIAVVGDREIENQTVSVRRRGQREQETLAVARLIEQLQKEIARKR